jgi:hypothetical protein
MLNKIKEYTDDIPEKNVEELFSLHNKVCEPHQWYMHSKPARLIVLNNLKEWLEKVDIVLNKFVRAMTKEQKIFLLKTHNILFPNNKEVSYSCSSCRQRMINRINSLKMNQDEL